MAFTGNENHSITLQDAQRFTRNYRETTAAGATLAGYFGKSALSAILNQANCVGLRIYNAKADDGKSTFVLVGVNADGDDLTGGEIAEFSHGCPPFCSKNTALME